MFEEKIMRTTNNYKNNKNNSDLKQK